MDFERHRKKDVMGLIASATDLEQSGRELEAYCAYLTSVQEVCSLLGDGLSSDTDRSQMIVLARQCLERLQHISDRFGHKKLPPDSDSPWRSAASRKLRVPPPSGPFKASASAWSTYRDASVSEPDDPDDPTAPPGDPTVSPSDLTAPPGDPTAPPGDPSAPPGDSDDSIEDNRLVATSDSENAEQSSFEDNNLVVIPPTPAPRSGKEEGQPEQEGPSSRRGSGEEPFHYGTDVHRCRVPVPKPVEELDPTQELSPLDVARKENERLVASYALRMQRSPKHVQHNLSLELQRRLSENRQIATVKHQAWLRRRHEAREHFLQLAKRVFPEPSAGQTTAPDQLQQKQTTLADILQFEQTHPWTHQLRDSLDADSGGERTVENALLHMLLEKSHPLSKLRQRLQYSLFCKLNPLVEQHAHLLDAERVPKWSPAPALPSPPANSSPPPAGTQGLWPSLPPGDWQKVEKGAEGAGAVGGDATDSGAREQQDEAFRRHLRNVISDTQDSEQLLVSLAGAVHPSLSGPGSRPVVQRVLFTPLWPHLLVLFRLANRRQESLLATALTRLNTAGAHPTPIRPHRILLRRLLLATSPSDKARLLVELVRALCETSGGPGGADVLLPRLTALVVHSSAPQLLSELQFISEFVTDGGFQGEQGYCLTSLETTLMYLTQQE